MTAIAVFSFCRIFSKAGYSWAFGLLLLIPVGNIGAISLSNPPS